MLNRVHKVLFCCTTEHLRKIFPCFPTRFGEVHKQVVATVARRSPGNIALERNNEFKGLLYKRQNICRGDIALYYKVVACEATHRTPIYYARSPHRVVAQECGCKMLYSVYGTGAQHRFSVRLFHPYIEGGNCIAAKAILARNIYSAFQSYMVYCKRRYLFHFSKFREEHTGYIERTGCHFTPEVFVLLYVVIYTGSVAYYAETHERH